ncbi:hypothetical protein C8R45DRAFT_1090419 [Mycena sanguinolenta]|nr:hypothetical protein C8R45DRAFT_1090419 [Mycena sanguinolenta]
MSGLPSPIEDLTEKSSTFGTEQKDLVGDFDNLVAHNLIETLEVVYLFLLNRYVTPLGFIVNLFAYLSPTWTFEARSISSGASLQFSSMADQPIQDFRCHHFIRYEGSMTVIGIHVVGLMMLIRINALYADKRWVVFALGTLWVIMFSVQAWLLSKGQPVQHNPASGVRVEGRRVPANRNRKRRDGSSIMKRLFRDGLIYYSAIFAVNAVLTIMIISAPPGLKNIAAQLELLVTVTMMSRITLNLKKLGAKQKLKLMGTTLADSGLPVVFGSNGPTGQARNTQNTGTMTSTLGIVRDARPMDSNW